MRLSSAGIELLKKAEGFRDRIYLDVAGFQTIGFGHRVLPRETFPAVINLAQGEAILACDIRIAEATVERLVKVALKQGQFDALVDFVFNLGAGRLASSTLLKHLNAGKYDAAAWQLLAWDHSGAIELASLKRRREAEFALWGTNETEKQAAA